LKDSPLYKLQKKVYHFFLEYPDAMSLSGCDFPEWDNATINEKPLTRSFEFVADDGKSMIEFTLSEIKMMPDFVRELFVSPDTRKDVGHILRKLNDWCFFYFEPELFDNMD